MPVAGRSRFWKSLGFGAVSAAAALMSVASSGASVDAAPVVSLAPTALLLVVGAAVVGGATGAFWNPTWHGALPLALTIAPALVPRVAAAWTYNGTAIACVWALVAAAVCAARLEGMRPRARPGTSATLAVVLATAWLGGVATAVHDVAMTGDAPHYLVIAQSVLNDGDFDLRNNYDDRTYTPFFGASLEPRHTNPGYLNEHFSFHGPAVSLLVAPGFALFGSIGATATLVLLLALGSGLQWLTVWRLTHDAGAAWFGWAALVLAAPYALHSAAIYPDGPAAVAATAALWLLARLGDHRPTPLLMLAAVGVGLAAMPWLHVRLSLPAGVLGIAIVASILHSQPDKWTRASWFLMVPIISCAAWLAASYEMFGTFDPTAAMRQRTAPAEVTAAPVRMLAMLTDLEFGLFPTTPVTIAAPIAFVFFLRRHRLPGLATGLTALGVWSSSSLWVWWGGDAAPGRFLLVTLPLVAAWLAELWQRSGPPARRLLVMSLVLSGTFTALTASVDGGARAYNFPDGRFTVFESFSASVDVSQGLPSWLRAGASPASELPVAVVWLAVVVTLTLVVTMLHRVMERQSELGRWAAAVAATLVLAAVGVHAGWAARGVAGWTPGSSAIALARSLAAPGSIALAGYPIRWAEPASVAAALRLTTPEYVAADPRALLLVPHVPAGRYGVVTSGGLGDTQTLALTLGRDAATSTTWRLSDAPPTFVLATAVHSVTVWGAKRAGLDTWLRWLGPPPRTVAGEARRVTAIGDVTVYSMDDNHYPDAEGLWVGSNRKTRLLVAASNKSTLTVCLEAGPAAVTVDLASPAAGPVVQRRLAPQQRETWPLGVLGIGEVAELSIAVAGGFPASALNGPGDSRHLGARVTFTTTP